MGAVRPGFAELPLPAAGTRHRDPHLHRFLDPRRRLPHRHQHPRADHPGQPLAPHRGRSAGERRDDLSLLLPAFLQRSSNPGEATQSPPGKRRGHRVPRGALHSRARQRLDRLGGGVTDRGPREPDGSHTLDVRRARSRNESAPFWLRIFRPAQHPVPPGMRDGPISSKRRLGAPLQRHAFSWQAG